MWLERRRTWIDRTGWKLMVKQRLETPPRSIQASPRRHATQWEVTFAGNVPLSSPLMATERDLWRRKSVHRQKCEQYSLSSVLTSIDKFSSFCNFGLHELGKLSLVLLTMDDATPSASSTQSASAKYAERIKRLRDLHAKRNEARMQNHKEVIEEDKRNKLPANWESRKRQAEWIMQDEAARKEAEDKGEDYERKKLLNIDATEAERIARKKRSKQNPDPGFSDYEQAAIRSYNRLVKNIKPNMEEYEEAKEKLGPAFYGDPNTILHGLHEDKKEAIDKMVTNLEKQIAKREKYSRRRMHNDDADIDYINERNAKFNQKLERFYGEYTRETKLNLERGTAI